MRRPTSRNARLQAYARLVPDVQRETLAVLGVIAGASQDEKWVMREALSIAAGDPMTQQADLLPELLRALGALVSACEVASRPSRGVESHG
jgi:hypothetical protein